MKRFLYFLFAIAVLAGCRSDGKDVREAVERQMCYYPQSALQDVYKSFYQDRFGPGHMIQDTAAFGEYTRYELTVAAAEDTVCWPPLYEPVGAQGHYVRVYLICVNAGLLTEKQLSDAFLRSITPAEEPKQSWADEWAHIEQAAREAGIPCPDEDCEQLRIAAKDNRAVHHSDAYRNAYHPHYRIIRRDIFEKELKPFIIKTL